MNAHTITIFNTITGRKEAFQPLIPRRVRMYVCGVTVYDYCHLGHARSALVFDVWRRVFEDAGYDVTFVKNFTDIDDKIIARAREQRRPWQDITTTYIAAYHEDMRRLGVQPATVEPKATEHMGEIIALVALLLEKGIAYRLDGDVYFDVEQFPSYGMLSKRKLQDLQVGARIEIDARKRHPADFALWKSAKPDEPAWASPWGKGRPGWHIECSAMSMKHLGETFDVHGGGEDLIFPHHENEIAQSTAATGQLFARYWVHNGFVRINQEKMSKSLGNFFTIRDIFGKSRWPESITAEMLRYFLLATHYRSPLDFSDQALEEAKRALDGLYGLLSRLKEDSNASDEAEARDAIRRARQAFDNSLHDDLNTPGAVAALQDFRTEVNKLLERGLSQPQRGQVHETFRSLGRVIGLLQLPPSSWQFNPSRAAEASGVGIEQAAVLSDADIEAKVAERNAARRQKDFATADRIRAYLVAAGITIEDRPDGSSRWKR